MLCPLDGDVIADLRIRKRNRVNYPGACSLDYQAAMQIVLECLFGWDVNKQEGKEGILGILEAFCRGDEEQGRFTLHSHWLIWVKKFGVLRKLLHATNKATRESAREEYIAYINSVMSAKYGDFEVVSNHSCSNRHECTGNANDVFENCDAQILRDARHKSECITIAGKVMQCVQCEEKVAPTDVMNNVLQDIKTKNFNRLYPCHNTIIKGAIGCCCLPVSL